jgi:hypothetical protein
MFPPSLARLQNWQKEKRKKIPSPPPPTTGVGAPSSPPPIRPPCSPAILPRVPAPAKTMISTGTTRQRRSSRPSRPPTPRSPPSAAASPTGPAPPPGQPLHFAPDTSLSWRQPRRRRSSRLPLAEVRILSSCLPFPLSCEIKEPLLYCVGHVKTFCVISNANMLQFHDLEEKPPALVK